MNVGLKTARRKNGAVDMKMKEVQTMIQVINGQLYECAPEVKDYITKLENENAALRLLIEWAEECDFGYDNFPEEYERYKDEIKDVGYIEGMIHIAKRVLSEKKGDR